MATATEAGSIPATKTSLALLFTLGRTYAPLVGVGDGKHVLTANEEDAARAMNVGRGGFVAAGAAAPMRRVKPAPAKTKAGAAGGVVHPMHAVPHLQLAKLANAGRKTKGGVWRAGNRKNPFRGAVAPPEPPATPPTPPEMRAKRAQKALVDGQSNCITVSLADFVSVWDTVALFIRTQMLRARAVHMPHMGLFTFAYDGAPRFNFNKRLAKITSNHGTWTPATTREARMNYVSIGVSCRPRVKKEDVRMVMDAVLSTFLTSMLETRSISKLDLPGVGQFQCRGGHLAFAFYRKFAQALTASKASPPKVTRLLGGVERDHEDPDTLAREGAIKDLRAQAKAVARRVGVAQAPPRVPKLRASPGHHTHEGKRSPYSEPDTPRAKPHPHPQVPALRGSPGHPFNEGQHSAWSEPDTPRQAAGGNGGRPVLSNRALGARLGISGLGAGVHDGDTASVRSARSHTSLDSALMTARAVSAADKHLLGAAARPSTPAGPRADARFGASPGWFEDQPNMTPKERRKALMKRARAVVYAALGSPSVAFQAICSSGRTLDITGASRPATAGSERPPPSRDGRSPADSITFHQFRAGFKAMCQIAEDVAPTLDETRTLWEVAQHGILVDGNEDSDDYRRLKERIDRLSRPLTADGDKPSTVRSARSTRSESVAGAGAGASATAHAVGETGPAAVAAARAAAASARLRGGAVAGSAIPEPVSSTVPKTLTSEGRDDLLRRTTFVAAFHDASLQKQRKLSGSATRSADIQDGFDRMSAVMGGMVDNYSPDFVARVVVKYRRLLADELKGLDRAPELLLEDVPFDVTRDHSGAGPNGGYVKTEDFTEAVVRAKLPLSTDAAWEVLARMADPRDCGVVDWIAFLKAAKKNQQAVSTVLHSARSAVPSGRW